MERLIRRRRECPEIGWGPSTVLDAGDPAVLAHRADCDGSTIVALHNLAGRPVDAAVVLGDAGDDAVLVDLFADDDVTLVGGARASGSRPTARAGCACAGAGSGSSVRR